MAALTPVPIAEVLTASAIVDVNGDGKNDVFIAQSDIAASDVVLLNDGNGSVFTARSLPPRYQGISGQTVVFEPGDFNEDGKVDLLVVTVHHSYTSAQIQLFLGQGNGTFVDASANITAGLWPLSAPYLVLAVWFRPGHWSEGRGYRRRRAFGFCGGDDSGGGGISIAMMGLASLLLSRWP